MEKVEKFQKFNPWSRHELLEEFPFHSPMQVIQSLSGFKAPLVSYPKLSVEQKIQLIEKICLLIEQKQEKIVQSESLAQGLPRQFVRDHGVKWVLRYIQSYLVELQSDSSMTFLPVGLVCLLPSWQLGFRQIAESIIPALITGNCLILKSDPRSRSSAYLWRDILNEAELPDGVVQVVDGDDELGIFLMKHPAFKTVCYSGATRFMERVWPSLPLFRKNFSFFLSTKNAMAILPETSDEMIAQNLRSCWVGYGELKQNIHRIFCTEKDFDRVQSVIATEIQKIQWDQQSMESSHYGVRVVQTDQNMIESLKSEVGQFLFEDKQSDLKPIVYMNMPHCSELQQDPASLLTVNSVKYVHEMAKWINNGYLGYAALVLGPTDKASSLGRKLEVSRVWINDWMSDNDPREVIHGLKLSCKGDVINELQSKLWQYR